MSVVIDTSVFYAVQNERATNHELSFTDASTITLVEERGIDSVLAFDDDFDGIVPRLDPKTLVT